MTCSNSILNDIGNNGELISDDQFLSLERRLASGDINMDTPLNDEYIKKTANSIVQLCQKFIDNPGLDKTLYPHLFRKDGQYFNYNQMQAILLGLLPEHASFQLMTVSHIGAIAKLYNHHNWSKEKVNSNFMQLIELQWYQLDLVSIGLPFEWVRHLTMKDYYKIPECLDNQQEPIYQVVRKIFIGKLLASKSEFFLWRSTYSETKFFKSSQADLKLRNPFYEFDRKRYEGRMLFKGYQQLNSKTIYQLIDAINEVQQFKRSLDVYSGPQF